MDSKKLFLTFIVIALLMTMQTLASTQGYIYSGTYELISWPVLNVTLTVGDTRVVGVLVVASPSSESMNQVFTGLLTLPNGTSYVVTGFLGTSMVYITSVNELSIQMPNQGVGNGLTGVVQTHGVIRAGTGRGGAVGSQTSTGAVGSQITNVSVGPLGSRKETRTVMTLNYWVIVILITTLITASLSIFIVMAHTRRQEYPECLERGIVKVIRRAGLRRPGMTHRELGDYLVARVGDEQSVRAMIRMFEEGVYGGRYVDCGEFMAIVRRVLRRLR